MTRRERKAARDRERSIRYLGDHPPYQPPKPLPAAPEDEPPPPPPPAAPDMVDW